MTTVTTRPATQADDAEVLEVLRAALGEPPTAPKTPESFAWKHRANPFGPSIVLIAEADGRIAGVRALMRWELATPSGETIRCVRPVDTATHPDFARRGIFRRLTMEALDVARAEGVDLVFNTPNPQSGSGYLSMGWHHVGWIDALVRPRLRRAEPAPDDAVPALERLVPGAEEIPTTVPDRPARGLRTRRSPAYVAWRFSNPAVPYGWIASGSRPGGAIVRTGVRSGRTETVLSDLLGGGAPDIRAVIRASRAHHVAGFFSRGAPERRSAVLGGLAPARWVKALQLVAHPLTDLGMDVADLRSWDLATSDLELL